MPSFSCSRLSLSVVQFPSIINLYQYFPGLSFTSAIQPLSVFVICRPSGNQLLKLPASITCLASAFFLKKKVTADPFTAKDNLFRKRLYPYNIPSFSVGNNSLMVGCFSANMILSAGLLILLTPNNG